MGNSNTTYSGNFLCEDLLPIEIWSKILHMIFNVEDIISLRRTCLLFRQLTQGTEEFTYVTNESNQKYCSLRGDFPYLQESKIKLILDCENLAIKYLADCIAGKYSCQLICRGWIGPYLYLSLEKEPDICSPNGLRQVITLYESKNNTLFDKEIFDKLVELSPSTLTVSCEKMGDVMLASCIASSIKLGGDQCPLHLLYGMIFGYIHIKHGNHRLGESVKEITCARSDFRKIIALSEKFIKELYGDISRAKTSIRLNAPTGRFIGSTTMSKKQLKKKEKEYYRSHERFDQIYPSFKIEFTGGNYYISLHRTIRYLEFLMCRGRASASMINYNLEHLRVPVPESALPMLLEYFPKLKSIIISSERIILSSDSSGIPINYTYRGVQIEYYNPVTDKLSV